MKIYFTRVLFIATHARVVAAVVTGTTLCGLASARAQAPSFTFTSLVDTSTSVPGQPGTTFNGFGAPSIQGGNVIFSGSNGSYTAIYTTPANAPALSTVVDANTTVPGHDGVTFSNVLVPTLSGSNIAFAGNSTAGSGYYTTTGSMSAITTLAERGEAAPGQTFATFGSFTGGPTVSGSNVAFYANYINANGDGTGNGSGIYTGTVGSSSATLVADRNTIAPGFPGVKFTGFAGTPNISASTTAFYGRFGNGTNQSGVYTSDPINGLKTIANTSTPIPGGDGTATFNTFYSSNPVISDTHVLFHGGNASTQGLYLGTAGATGGLLPIATIGTPVPGQNGSTISSFGTAYALSGTNAVFSATFSGGGQGILLYKNGALSDVINVGDSIAGGSLFFYTLSQDALDGNQLTFDYLLNSSDGPSGIEVVTIAVPEPATWAGSALLLGVAGLTLRRRSRARLAA